MNGEMYEHSPLAYDLLHAARKKDYGWEAAEVAARIRGHVPEARTILDVACGTGLHLAAFAGLGFDVEGVELSEGMIDVARPRVPDVPIHQGDMRTFRLDRRFDAVVCLFSAIGYMTDVDDLAAAVANLRDHLVGGGVLVIEPWIERADWLDGTIFAESAKSDDLAAARVSRSWQEGDESVIEMHYVLATRDRTWAFNEVHRMGLFTAEQQLDVYRSAGLSVEYEEPGLTGRGLIVAVKPPGS